MFLLLETSINERFTSPLECALSVNVIYHLYEAMIGASEHFKPPPAAPVGAWIDRNLRQNFPMGRTKLLGDLVEVVEICLCCLKRP